MKKRLQSVIGFGRKALEYCGRCDIVYNSTNAHDVSFHSRIHAGQRMTRRAQITRDIYKQGRRYVYGRGRPEAWVELEPRDGLFVVRERWSSGPEALGVLMGFVKTKYRALLNDS